MNASPFYQILIIRFIELKIVSLIKGIPTQDVGMLSSRPFTPQGLEPLSPASRNSLNQYASGLGFHVEERTLCCLDHWNWSLALEVPLKSTGLLIYRSFSFPLSGLTLFEVLQPREEFK